MFPRLYSTINALESNFYLLSKKKDERKQILIYYTCFDGTQYFNTNIVKNISKKYTL